ncbi:MAG: amidohydrolase family protein [Planctomycetota bacterium]
MRTFTQFIAAASLGLGALVVPAAAAGDAIVVRAGTIHLVEGDPITGGGAVVVEDGKIVAVGPASSIEAPGGARTIDYGPDAVIVPGLVAADSTYASGTAGPRTADPTVFAVDQFDPYAPIVSALRSGVTTCYLAPARGRLIAGQGAVVKTGGGSSGDPDSRVVLASAGLHGSITEEARRTPGYWEPPVPATVDIGLGVERPQLPKTTMGAVLAIDELMAFAKGDDSFAEEYGEQTGPELASAMKAKKVWRMGGESAAEVRALLDVKQRHGIPLVIDGASRAASMASAIAAAKVPVIARPYFNNGGNFGKSETSDWPSYGHIARLAGEGVVVAIDAPGRLGASDLRFGAALAMRGGLSRDHALRGITLSAAEVLGVADRVGSLAPGKDADMVVMTGDPLSVGSSVLATMIGGEVVWSPEMAGAARAKKASGHAMGPAVVISVDELHVGNGVVHRPGEVLLMGGKIAEVASRVSRPAGAMVVRGSAAMPGMIDAYGHLGTEGGNRPFSTRFDLSRILEPGDYADREVAKRGVTTVNLISRGLGGVTPSIAYKPAATSFDHLVVDGQATVVMQWDSSIVAQSGASVRQTLAKAKQYADKWAKYEADMAKWTPPAPEPESAKDDDEEEESDDEEENGDDKKKKKKKKERDPAKPVTGVFEGKLQMAEDGPEGTIRFRFLEDEDGSITGTVRTSLHEELFDLEGSREDYDVTIMVEMPEGDFVLHLAQIYSNDPPPKGEKKSKKKKDTEKKDTEKKDTEKKSDKDKEDADKPVETYLRGDAKMGDVVVASIDVTQTSSEYKVARRTKRLPEETEKKKAPKGMPKKPSIDPDLEPLRRAMMGGTSVFVSVNRDDQILRCVDTFQAYGIQPVLWSASDAHEVAGQIAGRVRGVLISRNRMIATEEDGTQRNRLVELSAAGIPVAFFSQAEEGAAELGVIAAMAVARGLSPSVALRGLTADAAAILGIGDRVGTLEIGKDGDVIVLNGSPLEVSSSIERVFLNGREVR